MAVTKRSRKTNVRIVAALTVLAGTLLLGFQNCAVDLLSSTPGASSLGACAAPPTAALTSIQTVITGVLQTSCASCHGVTTGSIKSAFYVPDATSDAATTSVQTFAYTQLCLRGGLTVGLKIDGSNSHAGGTFSRAGSAAPLYSFLTTYF